MSKPNTRRNTATTTATTTATNNQTTTTAPSTHKVKLGKKASWVNPSVATQLAEQEMGCAIVVSNNFAELGFDLVVGITGDDSAIPETRLFMAGNIYVPASMFQVDQGVKVSPIRIPGFIFPTQGEIASKEAEKVIHPIVEFNYLWLVENITPYINKLIKKHGGADVTVFELDKEGMVKDDDSFWGWTLPPSEGNTNRDFDTLNSRRTLLDINQSILAAIESSAVSGAEYSVETHNCVVAEIIATCNNEFQTRYGGKRESIPVNPNGDYESVRGDAIIIKPEKSGEGLGRTLTLEVQEGIILLGQIQERIKNKRADALFTGNMVALVLSKAQATLPSGISVSTSVPEGTKIEATMSFDDM
jgi:hypothetical protein